MQPYFDGYKKWKKMQHETLILDLEKLHEYDKRARLV